MRKVDRMVAGGVDRMVAGGVDGLSGIISGLEVGDKVEVLREEVERGSCSLMCTFELVCGDCNGCNQGRDPKNPVTEWWRVVSDW
jgi:hypothetical protein